MSAPKELRTPDVGIPVFRSEEASGIDSGGIETVGNGFAGIYEERSPEL